MMATRSRFTAALVPVMAAIAWGSAAPLLAGNLGFEDGLEGWTIRPEGAGFPQACEEAAALGQRGLRVMASAQTPQGDITSPKVEVTPGTAYQITFWSGTADSSPAMASAEMIYFDESGNEVAAGPSPQGKRSRIGVPWGSGWSPAQLVSTAPENARALAVRIKPVKGAAGSSVNFDDIAISGYQEHAATVSEARIKALEDEIRANPTRGKTPPKIVLKLDDLKPVNGGVHPNWARVADFAKEKNIKLAAGIIAEGLASDGIESFVSWVREQHTANRMEFWNHGWDHSAGQNQISEFKGQPYEFQKDHMLRANRLAREKLGFAFESFGAPFNATDASTAKVLSEEPDIKVWIYGDASSPAGKKVLIRSAVTIETNMKPDYGSFLEAYAHNRGAEYFVMQGHPGGWNEAAFAEFVRIVDFLSSVNATFVLPRGFANRGPDGSPSAHISNPLQAPELAAFAPGRSSASAKKSIFASANCERFFPSWNL